MIYRAFAAITVSVLLCLMVAKVYGPMLFHEYARISMLTTHEKQFNEYKQKRSLPTSYHDPDGDGLFSYSVGFSPDQSLHVLAGLGDLRTVQLTFLNIAANDREAFRIWTTFLDNHPEVTEAYSHDLFPDFELDGEPPLQLVVWFPESARDSVVKLAKELTLYGRQKKELHQQPDQSPIMDSQ